MSNIRISQLPAADTPLSGAEIMPIVQDGITVKATINQVGDVFTSNTLQTVTDNGNNTTNDIEVNSVGVYDSANTGYISIEGIDNGILINQTAGGQIFSVQSDAMSFGGVSNKKVNLHNALLSDDQDYEFPDKSGTIALTDDITTSTLQQVTTLANRVLTNNINLQGTNAGTGTFSGTNINGFGGNAAKDNTGNAVNALGYEAAQNNSVDNLNAFGTSSAKNNTGDAVNALGYGSAYNNSGSSVNALGNGAADNNSGLNVNALGNQASSYNTNNNMNAFGYQSAFDNRGINVNGLGYEAAKSNLGGNVNAIGYQAGLSNTFSNVTLLGNSAQASAAKQLVLADGTLNARISYANINANRTYELPNVSGTFPVMSGSPTPPNWTGFIPRWVGQSNIGASTLLSDNSSTISIGNSSPSASARLQVDSTTSGFLPPRMPTSNRTSISSPAEGLCVYDTTLHNLYVYDGTAWRISLNPSLQSVTDSGYTTTNDINVNSVSVYDPANSGYINIGSTDNGIEIKQTTGERIFGVQSDAMGFGGVSTKQAVFHNNLLSADRDYELPNTAGIIAVSTTLGYSGSKVIGGLTYTWQNGILITVV